MKHFEEFWNEAEKIADQLNQIDTVHRSNIIVNVDKFSKETDEKARAILIGHILFDLCALTSKYNINSAAALKHVMEEYKAKLLDPDEDNEDE